MGLRAGSIVLSERMNDWRYLSLRDLEQNEFFPKVNLKVFLYLNVNYGLVTCHVTKKIKIKEIGELVANLLYFCLNPIGRSPFSPLTKFTQG